MTSEVFLYPQSALPQPSPREILRYMRAPEGETAGELLLDACLSSPPPLDCRVCGTPLPFFVDGDRVALSFTTVQSHHLARYLFDCTHLYLFAATVGVGIDRLILKHSRLAPAKALAYSAIGSERVEALCDLFCGEIAKRYAAFDTKPRFSPGYGDLPLSIQNDIFSVLGCTQRIGISLGESGLISPTKSVTAFIGIKKRK